MNALEDVAALDVGALLEISRLLVECRRGGAPGHRDRLPQARRPCPRDSLRGLVLLIDILYVVLILERQVDVVMSLHEDGAARQCDPAIHEDEDIEVPFSE